MKVKNALLTSRFLVTSWLLATCVAAAAESHGDYKEAGGIGVYLGQLPAAMIQGHPAEHPETAMHEGIPDSRHAYHLVVAVFDATTGERISGAAVEARVTPLGLAGVRRPLESMEIAGTETYGNYFSLHGDGPIQIEVMVAAPAKARQTFSYEFRQGGVQ